jgi:LysM repeat protein
LGNPINPEELIDFENLKPKSEVYSLVNKTTFNHIIEQGKVKYWTVKQGDTLSRIASRTGVSVKQLCSLNKITTKTILRIGQKIRYN